MVQERYITAREVAERVGLSPDTILRYYREGRIPGRRLHGTIRPVRFLWSEVEAAWDGRAQLSLEDGWRDRAAWIDLPHGRWAVGDPLSRCPRTAASGDGVSHEGRGARGARGGAAPRAARTVVSADGRRCAS